MGQCYISRREIKIDGEGGGSGNADIKFGTISPVSNTTFVIEHNLSNYNDFVEWFDENVKPQIIDVLDVEYQSPYDYGNSGDWLIWRPKNTNLHPFLGGIQFIDTNYINIQTYFNNSSDGHDFLNIRSQTFKFYRSGNTIIFGVGEQIVPYIYFHDNACVFSGAKWCVGGDSYISKLPILYQTQTYGEYLRIPYGLVEIGYILENVYFFLDSNSNRVNLPSEFMMDDEHYVTLSHLSTSYNSNVAVKI